MSARGRKPDPAVDAKIKEAAAALLFSHGIDFTMDDVAARAGVGRASVFRRFPTKRDLLLTAVSAMMEARVAIPDTGSLEGDLRAVAADTLAAWQAPPLAKVSRQVFGTAGTDPAIGEIVRDALRNRQRQSWGIYERAVERGEIPADADFWLLSDLLWSVITCRGLLDLDLPTAEGLVRALMYGFASR